MIIVACIIFIYSILITIYAIRVGRICLVLQDAIQESVDILDVKYENMSKILSRPLFLDSPEVRQVVQDIADVRNSFVEIVDTLQVTEVKNIDIGDNVEG